MKIAVTAEGPNKNSMTDSRFGRAPYIVVLDTESDEVTTIDNQENASVVQGAGIQASKQVVESGVQVLITGCIGPKAHEVLKANDVVIYTNAAGTVDEVTKQFVSGELKRQKVPEYSGQRRGYGYRHGGGRRGVR